MKLQFSMRSVLLVVLAICLVLPAALRTHRRFQEHQDYIEGTKLLVTEQLKTAQRERRNLEVRLDIDERLAPQLDDAIGRVQMAHAKLRELDSRSWDWLFD